MYIAMNHFHVAAGRSEEFERAWAERDSYLADVAGFVAFHLVRAADDADGSHRYASHTTWESEAAFAAWTESESFRKAHARGGKTAGMLLGPPRFAGWTAVV